MNQSNSCLRLAVAAVLMSCACQVQATEARVAVNIPAQPVSAALKQLGRQSGLQFLLRIDSADEVVVQPVEGQLSLEAVLNRMLAGSGLRYEFVNPRTVRIWRAVPISWLPDARATHVADNTGGLQYRAQADGGLIGGEDAGRPLEEVVVTAQKRSERLQDVPVPVTVIAGDSLVTGNQLQLETYAARIPGIGVSPSTFGSPRVTIRGLTTGGGNPTVGIVVDDIPYNSSTNLGGGNIFTPDIDPSDLKQLEVLRGPQGTLYGANSLGGLLKYETLDPSTSKLSGRLQVGGSSIQNGDKLGYNVRGAVNVPLGDTFAIRASAFRREDPGYIDNIQTGQDAINRLDAKGGRVAALWKASDVFSLKLSAQVQENEAHGSPYIHVQPGLGELEQSALVGTGVFTGKFQAYTATATADLGAVELTSLSGYRTTTVEGTTDYTFSLGARSLTQFGVGSAPLTDRNETHKFTQEIRASAPLGDRFEGLLGVFYTNEHSRFNEDIYAANTATGDIVAQWVDIFYPTTYKEYAAFANLTYKVTDRFDIQFGGRESRNEQTYEVTWTGPYVPLFLASPSPLMPPPVSTKENAFTYLVTPRFRFSDDLMMYARLASGYRPGGPNSNSTRNPLPTFDSDTTQNYEIGVKGALFDRFLSYDASVYYIDWKDVQIQLRDPVSRAVIYGNATRAKSQGVELSVESAPIHGFSVSSWVAWNEAELTENLPNGTAVGFAGDRLPASAKRSGSLSLNQEWAFPNGMMGNVGGSVSYVGERLGVFNASNIRQRFPAYAQTDLRAGVRYDTWSVNAFMNNVTDRRGLLPSGSANPVAYYIIQPRTVGLSLAKTF